MSDSEIIITDGGTMFTGHDAVELFRAITLESSLRLYAKTKIVPTRGVTITRMVALATRYTGKKYGRGDAARAAHDIKVWIETMKSALPVSNERQPDTNTTDAPNTSSSLSVPGNHEVNPAQKGAKQ